MKPDPRREGGAMSLMEAIVGEFCAPFPSLGGAEMAKHVETIRGLATWQSTPEGRKALEDDLLEWSLGEWAGRMTLVKSIYGSEGGKVTIVPNVGDRWIEIRKFAKGRWEVEADYALRPSRCAAGGVIALLEELGATLQDGGSQTLQIQGVGVELHVELV